MAEFSLADLEGIVAARARSGDPQSWTAKLAALGMDKAAQKLGEEAVETVIAVVKGDRERIVAESADLLYHWLVVLALAGVPLSDVMALADTMYVSFYKGLGAIAGAALVGPKDVIDEARLWRRRMGGTIFHLTAEAVTALSGLERELPHMAARRTWAREVAQALTARGFRCQPEEPHTSTFLVHAEGDADALNERLVAWIEERGVLLTGTWRPGAVPGTVVNELVVAGPALEHEPADVADWLAEVALA